MSTFFRSAAMTLLSKTLQTLLYKYLSDVDVEGVALPSLYNSDGHSGWGIRLKNVRVREGAKLMDLPGKPKRRKQQKRSGRSSKKQRQKKKQKQNRKRRGSSEVISNGGGNTAMTTNAGGSSSEHHQQQVDDINESSAAGADERLTNAAPYSETVNDRHGDPRQQYSDDTNDDGLASKGSEEEAAVAVAAAAAAAAAAEQAPVVAATKSSWFSWGRKVEPVLEEEEEAPEAEQGLIDGATTPDAESNETTVEIDIATATENDDIIEPSDIEREDRAMEERMHDVNISGSDDQQQIDSLSDDGVAAAPTQGSSSWFMWSPRSESRVKKMVELNADGGAFVPPPLPPLSEKDAAAAAAAAATTTTATDPTARQEQFMAASAHMKSFGEESVNTTSIHPECDDDEDDVDEYDSETDDDEDDSVVDEEEDSSPPMILRLGKGGRIGLLDVRLVGKDIHVYVEDAFLTVEAVQVSQEETDPTKAAADKDAKPTPAAPEKKPSVAQEKPEPRTIGERVLAENAIARALSAIPNMFLRDIQVHFVMRDETDGEAQQESSDKVMADESVVEIGIEFLSVTDGDDFFANFRNADDDESDSGESGAGDDDDRGDGDSRSYDFEQENDEFSRNEYLVKRIRTGRGPEGGVCMRVYPSGKDMRKVASRDPDHVWSRSSWISTTEHCFFRLSGLDLHARIFLGTEKDIAASNNAWYGDDQEDFTDSILFGGVDYIAPAPPPLPPVPTGPSIPSGEEIHWAHPSVTNYKYDANGIQWCPLSSSFHRVARGLTPLACERNHLPCEQCPNCWSSTSGKHQTHKMDTAMPMAGLVVDLSVRDAIEANVDRPTLQVFGQILAIFTKKKKTEEEPSALGETKSLDGDDSEFGATDFRRGSNRSLDVSERSAARSQSGVLPTTTRLDEGMSSLHVRRSSSSVVPVGSSHRLDVSRRGGSALLKKRSVRRMDESGGHGVIEPSSPSGRTTRNLSRHHVAEQNIRGNDSLSRKLSLHGQADDQEDDDDITYAFPTYMQPEKIQIMGIHLSEIVFRIHVMESGAGGDLDRNLGFCYWDVHARCVTLDHQKLTTHRKPFQDLRFDVGQFAVQEYRGCEESQLVCLGVRQPVIDLDEVTVESIMTNKEDTNRSPWPSTAAALLDVPPPLETLMYKARERHAIQLRFVSTGDHGEHLVSTRQKAHVRVGVFYIDISYDVKDKIPVIIAEAKRSVLGRPKDETDDASNGTAEKSSEAEDVSAPKVDSVLKYKLELEGGRAKVDPLIDVRLPLTALKGEKSTKAGLSFETLLDHVNLNYRRAQPPAAKDCGLSLDQLAELPENARLRILLFLPDLKPIEAALGLKPETNPFMRCRAVNRGIVKRVKSHRKRSSRVTKKDPLPEGNRRQAVIDGLMRLDDETLADLWRLHKQRPKRASKRPH